MRSDHAFYSGLFVVILIAAAFLAPNNSITGNVVREDCGTLGCSELCEVPADSCEGGYVCCPTFWENGKVGLCDYAENCAVISAFSSEMDMEEYIAVREEGPLSVKDFGMKNFWLPLLVTLTICFGAIRLAQKQKI